MQAWEFFLVCTSENLVVLFATQNTGCSLPCLRCQSVEAGLSGSKCLIFQDISPCLSIAASSIKVYQLGQLMQASLKRFQMDYVDGTAHYPALLRFSLLKIYLTLRRQRGV